MGIGLGTPRLNEGDCANLSDCAGVVRTGRSAYVISPCLKRWQQLFPVSSSYFVLVGQETFSRRGEVLTIPIGSRITSRSSWNVSPCMQGRKLATMLSPESFRRLLANLAAIPQARNIDELLHAAALFVASDPHEHQLILPVRA